MRQAAAAGAQIILLQVRYCCQASNGCRFTRRHTITEARPQYNITRLRGTYSLFNAIAALLLSVQPGAGCQGPWRAFHTWPPHCANGLCVRGSSAAAAGAWVTNLRQQCAQQLHVLGSNC